MGKHSVIEKKPQPRLYILHIHRILSYLVISDNSYKWIYSPLWYDHLFESMQYCSVILVESLFHNAVPVHAKRFSCTWGTVEEFPLNTSAHKSDNFERHFCTQFYCQAFPSIETINIFCHIPFLGGIFFFVIPPEFLWKSTDFVGAK